MSRSVLRTSGRYTEFEQAIFDRSLKNYKNKHGDHPGGHDWAAGRSDIFYKTETLKTDMWDEFWDRYLNSNEKLL